MQVSRVTTDDAASVEEALASSSTAVAVGWSAAVVAVGWSAAVDDTRD